MQEHDIAGARAVTYAETTTARTGSLMPASASLATSIKETFEALEMNLGSKEDVDVFAQEMARPLQFWMQSQPVPTGIAMCRLIQAADSRAPGNTNPRFARDRTVALWETRGLASDVLANFFHRDMFE